MIPPATIPTMKAQEPRGQRQSLAWLHTWSGLMPGWILFLVFLFGTTAFFQQEISAWMRPEVRAAPVSEQALDAAGEFLKTRAANAETWAVWLPDERRDGLYLAWVPQGGNWSRYEQAMLDPASGREIVVRDTQGGLFLYLFHFDLHYMSADLANYIVSIATLAMLVAILSGIITHKRIFADFFMLRLGKGQRSWLDVHNVTGVLALPFHLMITYTGLVTLLFTLMPWAISANYPDRNAFADEAYSHPHGEASGTPAPVLSLYELFSRARTAGENFAPAYIHVEHPGDASALAEVYLKDDQLATIRGIVYMSGVSGEVLQAPRAPGPASTTVNVMVDLHAARFAEPVLRWLYFLAGLGGTVMVATGLVLWTVKRRAKLPNPALPHIGFKLVERLNIGVIVGATAGIAGYFLANRLLPLGMANRMTWEINSLFIIWGALFVWSIGRPAKQAWTETLATSALLYALVPVVSAVATPRGLIPSLIEHDWVFAGFDLTMLATAAVLALAAWRVAAHKPKVAKRRMRSLTEATT